MTHLTERQMEILCFIVSYTDSKGYTPSMRDVGEYVGVDSTNAVSGHLNALEKKGYIARTPRIARSLRVLKRPSRENIQMHR